MFRIGDRVWSLERKQAGIITSVFRRSFLFRPLEYRLDLDDGTVVVCRGEQIRPQYHAVNEAYMSTAARYGLAEHIFRASRADRSWLDT